MSEFKTDPELGKKVHDYLLDKKVETAFTKYRFAEKDEALHYISDNVTNILDYLGIDLTDPNFKDTPSRVADMYLNEIYYGLDYNNFPKCSAFEGNTYDGMVIERNISVMSQCAHHQQPIIGTADIAYIPKKGGSVIGLSKLNRIVDFFSRRPQIQEMLTQQIFWALSFILDTKDIAVIIKAEHFCVKVRGVKDQNSFTTTAKLDGAFMNDPSVRSEFYSLVR